MPRRTRENTLSMYWSKREKDIVYAYPSKVDGHMLHHRLGSEVYNKWKDEYDLSFFKELEARGYDLTTLRFSICKKEDHPRWKKDEPQKQIPTETSGSND